MSLLASDLNNPAFVGAMNPDSVLSAEFYWHEPEDVHKSEAAGECAACRDQEANYRGRNSATDLPSRTLDPAVRGTVLGRW